MLKEYKKPLKFIFDSFKWHKKLFVIFLIWKMVEWIFYVVVPILAKLEMDQLAEKNEQLFGFIEASPFNIFLVILGIIFIFSLFENILKSFLFLFTYRYTTIYDNFYTKSLYNRLKNSEPGFFLNSRNKRFVNEILWNTTIVSNSIRNFLWDTITNFFVLIWILWVLTLLNIWFLVILIIAWIIIYFLEKIKNKIYQKIDFEKNYDYKDKLNIVTEQLWFNFNQLISSGWFLKVLIKFEDYNEELRKKILDWEKNRIILDILIFFIENTALILIKIFVWFTIFFSSASIWIMTMTVLYTQRINDMISFFRRFKFGMIELRESLGYLNLFLEVTEEKKSKNIFLENFEKLNFKKVNFSYPNFVKQELKYLEIFEKMLKERWLAKTEFSRDWFHMIEEARKTINQEQPIILKNINLDFEVWKTYWIVGKNWAWKTTIISLLQNFFDNYDWEISIDGKEIKNFERKFFEKNISVINQIPYVIEGFTVKENILLWVEKEVSDEEIYNFLEKFWLKKKVERMRKKLDAKIGYDNDFSGWEKQLLVLIRIILQDRKILIMDEWTNQLDADNELKVMEELLKYKENKIVIFITHRMTSIRKVDKIYCLENWEINIYWTHNELIWKKNIYNDFWEKQVWE